MDAVSDRGQDTAVGEQPDLDLARAGPVVEAREAHEHGVIAAPVRAVVHDPVDGAVVAVDEPELDAVVADVAPRRVEAAGGPVDVGAAAVDAGAPLAGREVLAVDVAAAVELAAGRGRRGRGRGDGADAEHQRDCDERADCDPPKTDDHVEPPW